MLFVLVFIVLVLALPLSVEIYKRGTDNIIARSGRDLIETKALTSITSRSLTALSSASDFVKGSIALVTFGVTLFILWKGLALVVRLFLQ
jgi:hypothetical protein